MSDEQEALPALACKGCGATLLLCECCEREDCTEACCYRCMAFDLRERIGPLHEHGG